MLRGPQSIPERVEATARQDGRLDFKDEGRTEDGIPIGKLTLHPSGDPVYSGGKWVTLAHALELSKGWGVELFEY